MIVRVQKPLYGGAFQAESGAVVALALPGKMVPVQGASQEVLEPASGRVEPGCVHFGVCGGCQYQHARYDVQAGWKREILAGLLAAAGMKALPGIETVTAEPWGYRNRIRLRVALVDGLCQVGYSRRGTNEFLPIRMCPIAAPVLWRAAEALLQLATTGGRGRLWLESAIEAELFCSGDEGRVQLQLFLGGAGAVRGENFAAFCEALKADLPELVGAGVLLDPEANRRTRKSWAGQSWGAAGLSYEVSGRAYWVSRGAFFQVNRFLVEGLVELVCEGAAGQLAWDLYAGVGLFSRVLAERFAQVVAVEGGEIAAADLEAAGRKAGFASRRQATLEFLHSQEHQRERPDLVVLDPPRAGLGLEGAAVLGRVGAARVVYVSCDPETLARDLAVLVRAGYGVERVVMIDLFPQTFHLETVVWLRRG